MDFAKGLTSKLQELSHRAGGGGGGQESFQMWGAVIFRASLKKQLCYFPDTVKSHSMEALESWGSGGGVWAAPWASCSDFSGL